MNIELYQYERQNRVYEKEHLLISGTGALPRETHDYSSYRRAGKDVGVKAKGQGDTEQPPVDRRSLLP
ncbi:MAG: hypothetical protein V7629_04130 [Motiliproteus sp.]